MAKSKPAPKGPGNRLVATLLVVGVLGITAIAAYIKLAPAVNIPDNLRAKPVVTSTPRPVDDGHVDVIKPHAKGTDITYGSKSTEVPAGADKVVTAVNGFLETCPFVPDDARATKVTIKNREAVISFTAAFYKTYGTTDEGVVVKGLQMSLGQFPDIDHIYLEADGHPIDTLGNIELNQGLNVIRPDGSEPAKPGAAQP